MNHCPVYQQVGGHAYGWVYPGPMGAVLTPSLIGVAEGGQLPNASTFCGRCEQVCPMRIPLPKMMRHWREREFERHLSPAAARYGLGIWAFFATRPTLYRFATDVAMRALALLGREQGPLLLAAARRRLDAIPRPRRAAGLDIPGAMARQERERCNERARRNSRCAAPLAACDGRRGAAPRGGRGAARRGTRAAIIPRAARATRRRGSRPSRPRLSAPAATLAEVAAAADVPAEVARYLREANLPATLRMGADARLDGDALGRDTALEISHGPSDGHDLNAVSAAFAAVAETGTLALVSGADNPTTLNFLPDNHIVVVFAEDVVGDYESVFARLRARLRRRRAPRTLNFITGPSRSADIEQTLLFGAHGPRRLHIVRRRRFA